MELACIQEPHDELITVEACRGEVAMFDNTLAMAEVSSEYLQFFWAFELLIDRS